MRHVLRVLIAVLALCVAPATAQPQEVRVALVIGVATYDQVAHLTNPILDAQRVHSALRATGFDVPDPVINPTLTELFASLRAFRTRLERADVAVLYFAGHGIQQQNDNWLIPRDAALAHPDDIPTEAVPLQTIVQMMQTARLRIVFVDACSDNPFLLRWPTTRQAGQGLGRIADDVLPEGTFVAFAAAAGQQAPDDGAFARALAEHMDDEGLALDAVINRVSTDIARTVAVSKRMNSPAPFFFVPARPLDEAAMQEMKDRLIENVTRAATAGQCDTARADLASFERAYSNDRTIVNYLRANAIRTCVQRTEVVATQVVAQTGFLATLVAADRSPLTRAHFEAAARPLDLEWQALAAASEVASGPLGGFAPDGRPVILFERHLFSRKTDSRYDQDHPHISNRTPGGYPRTQADRWAQLADAFALDPEAALQSASYGRFQVLGQNFSNLGLANAHEYVARLSRSERDQLDAFIGFIRANGLVDELQRRDWVGFCSRYFGPGYAANQYDTKMAAAYARLNEFPIH